MRQYSKNRGDVPNLTVFSFKTTPRTRWFGPHTAPGGCLYREKKMKRRTDGPQHTPKQRATGACGTSNRLVAILSLALAGCGGGGDGGPGAAQGSATDQQMNGASVAYRDPLQQPFSSDSIWNTPIGSDARYTRADFPAVPGGDTWAPMPQIDDEILVLRPKATLTPIYYDDAGWTGGNRCDGRGRVLAQVPLPGDYLVPHSRSNNSAAILAPDGRTVIQVQPFTRCTAGAGATSIVRFPDVDLYGDGRLGAHGGSGLSAIGGTLRLGELRPGSDRGPQHALKVNVYAKEMLFRCSVRSDCFRWPATKADSYAVGHYGALSSSTNRAMRMGALLAIPAWRDINSLKLETTPGRQLAWTLQNYGAYIVDDTWGPSFMFNVETGPDGSFREQFKADWGFALEQRVRDNTPWSRDVQRLMQALHVVDNNAPGSIGGGGHPLQPPPPK